MENITIKEVGLTDKTAEIFSIYCEGVLLTQRIEEANVEEWGVKISQPLTAFLDVLREMMGKSIESTLFEFLPFNIPDDAII